MAAQVRVATPSQRFAAAFRASSRIRWAILITSLLIAWLLLFWLVNLSNDAASPTPAVTAVPTSAV